MLRNFFGLLLLSWALMHLSPGQAAPTLISPPPASGVSPSAAIVFVFSEAMDPDPGVTFATFLNASSPFTPLPITSVWSIGNTVLTCTPSPAFPASTFIIWTVEGQNPVGDFLEGTTDGFFTTGTGSGGGGSGTNAITTFSVGKIHHYNQTSSGSPTLDPTTPYDFSGVTSLASNRTATNIILTLPTAAVSNMIQLPNQPENYIVYGYDTSLSAYDAAFPAGDYNFLVKSVFSNQPVVVNLPPPASLPQPNAPHLSNYPAAQAVDPSQTFVLGWDAFAGATTADYIDVDVGDYSSPDPGLPGALNGTARTFTIPAGVLQPNSNYLSRVGFLRHVGTTNTSYATAAYRATYTEFSLSTTTTTATGGQLVLTNGSWSPGAFSFDVLCTNGQTVTVEYTNVLSAGAWPKLLTTNSPGPAFHVVSTQAVSQPSLFFRARNGP